VNAEAYLVEVLRDGRPAVAGELGRVVLTDLRGRAMPLLRYDTCACRRRTCACGRPWPVLGRMEGRADEALLRRDGGIVTTRAVLDALSRTDSGCGRSWTARPSCRSPRRIPRGS